MTRRSRAREVALQILYQSDLRSDAGIPRVKDTWENDFLLGRLRGNTTLIGFAREIVDGVRNNWETINTLLSKQASHWSLERLAKTDRNILRIGCYEILFGETPTTVAINEAIELGKRFGAADSGRFINGILDKIKDIDTSTLSSN